MVHHHPEYDYDDLVHHHSEYDYDDTMYHYIEQGDHMDEKHAKDYHDYMSCDDDSIMLKFPTLEDGLTYYGSSSPSLCHHEDHHRHTSSSSSRRHTKSDKGHHVDHHRQSHHVDPHRQAPHAYRLQHSPSTLARHPHKSDKAHEQSPRQGKNLHQQVPSTSAR